VLKTAFIHLELSQLLPPYGFFELLIFDPLALYQKFFILDRSNNHDWN